MTLIELRNYLMKHKRLLLSELAYHFNQSPQATQAMLDYWIRKGKVRSLRQECNKRCCCHNQLEIYEWVE